MMKFDYTDDIKDYVFETVNEIKRFVIKGMVIFGLTLAPINALANESFKYEMPTDKYEVAIDFHPILVDLDAGNKTIELFEKPGLLTGIKHAELMTGSQEVTAYTTLKAFSNLPIEDSFAQFNTSSGSLYVSMLLPEQLMVCTTRYMDENDDNIYFSVKGNGQLLYSGMLPLGQFVERTMEVIENVQSKARG